MTKWSLFFSVSAGNTPHDRKLAVFKISHLHIIPKPSNIILLLVNMELFHLLKKMIASFLLVEVRLLIAGSVAEIRRNVPSSRTVMITDQRSAIQQLKVKENRSSNDPFITKEFRYTSRDNHAAGR